MLRKFREYDQGQVYLLPPSLEDWIDESHLARFISETVDMLNIQSIVRSYESTGGAPPFHPRMMLKVMLYCYSTRRMSSRAIERATYDDVAVRFLSANQHPDHNTIASFRVRHLDAVEDIFKQVLAMARHLGLAKLGCVAIDGTKILANAARSRNVEVARIDELLQLEKERAAALLEEARLADEAENGDDQARLGGELAKSNLRQVRLKRAKEFVEAERERVKAASESQKQVREERSAKPTATDTHAVRPKKDLKALRERKGFSQQQLAILVGVSRAQLASIESLRRSPSPTVLDELSHCLECPAEEINVKSRQRLGKKKQEDHIPHYKPTPESRVNLTDPESKLIKPRLTDSSIQGFNAQLAVDGDGQFIVAWDVSRNPSDARNLIPMLDRVQDLNGREPNQLLADAGYSSVINLLELKKRGVDGYVPHERVKREFKNSQPVIEEMRKKLSDPVHKATYNRRSAIVEPVFGHLKGPLGFQRFRLRGLDKVKGEWGLMALCYNLGKLFRR